MKLKIRFLLTVLVLAVLLVSGTVAMAADGDFNAGITITNSADNSTITVAIPAENQAVLEAQHPTISIACSFTDAYVTYNGTVYTSTLADGKITFTVFGSGTYTITSGTPTVTPVDPPALATPTPAPTPTPGSGGTTAPTTAPTATPTAKPTAKPSTNNGGYYGGTVTVTATPSAKPSASPSSSPTPTPSSTPESTPTASPVAEVATAEPEAPAATTAPTEAETGNESETSGSFDWLVFLLIVAACLAVALTVWFIILVRRNKF